MNQQKTSASLVALRQSQRFQRLTAALHRRAFLCTAGVFEHSPSPMAVGHFSNRSKSDSDSATAQVARPRAVSISILAGTRSTTFAVLGVTVAPLLTNQRMILLSILTGPESGELDHPGYEPDPG